MAETLTSQFLHYDAVRMYYKASSACHWVFHSHPGFELHHCEKGEGVYEAADIRLPIIPSAVTLMYAPYRHHVFMRGTPYYECTVIEFQPKILGAGLEQGISALCQILPNQFRPVVQFTLGKDDHVRLDALLQCMQKEGSQDKRYSMLAISTYLMQILILLARSPGRIPEYEMKSAHERAIVEQVAALVMEWLEKDFNINDIARHFNISSGHLCRIFRKRMHMGLGQYITDKRIGRAYQLLRCGSTIKEAASKSNYGSVSSFTRAFKGKMGITPGELAQIDNLRRSVGSFRISIPASLGL